MSSVYVIPSDIDLKSYFLKYKHIYIYGAGKYGITCADLLIKLSIEFNGFIVSSEVVGNEKVGGYNVYSQATIIPDMCESDCVILAMKEEYQREVVRYFDANTKARQVSIIKHIMFKRELHKEFVNLIDNLSIQYPPIEYKDNRFSNILVIRLDFMGDLIWTSAFLRELRRNFPSANITVVCADNNFQILQYCPYIDNILEYEYTCDEATGKKSMEEVFLQAKRYAEKKLNSRKYDVVFLPRGISPMDNMANVYLAVLSSAKVRVAAYYQINNKVEAWYRDLMEKLFSVIAEHDYPIHDVQKALGLLKAIDCKVKDDDTEVWYKEKNKIGGIGLKELKLIRSKFEFFVAVGIASQGGAKIWNPLRYKELFRRVKKKFSVCFLLLGGQASKRNAQMAYNEGCCVDFVGHTDLHDVMQIISMCDFYIGSDTGLKHIAASFKKPVIEISASFPWGDDDEGLSPKHCGAWNTKYIVLSPDKPKSEKCAVAGHCVKGYSHCINNVSVDSMEKILDNFLLYYKF